MSLFLRSLCTLCHCLLLRRKISFPAYSESDYLGMRGTRLVQEAMTARYRGREVGRTAEEGRDDRRESKQEEVGRYCSVDMITSSGASSPKRGAFILLEGVDRCGKVSWWFCRQAYGIPLRTPLAQDERRAADISLLESPCSTKTTQVSLLVKHLLSLSLAATAFRFPDRTTQGVFIASRSGMG